MNSSKRILFHVLALSAAALIAGSAAADVPDQSNECLSGNAGNLNLSQPIGQTFKPSQDQLDAVEIRLVGFNTQAATVTVTVRETDFSGTAIGAKSETINFVDGVSDWYRFTFDAPLAVTPEATYMLALTVNNNAVGLPAGYCGTYTRGEAWVEGTNQGDDLEYGFRTFGPCGNGTVEPGEQCDDADTDRPCCLFPSCAFTDSGTQCPSGDLCSNAECDGAGQCLDYDGPRHDCSSPSKAVLSVKDSAKPGKDSVKFKWIKGDITASDAGAPRFSTDYALCVYAGDAPLVGATLPPQLAWDDGDYGKLYYKDKEGLVASFTAVSVKFTEEAGKSSASVSLGGDPLSLSVMSPVVPDVTAQILTSNGGCWSANFDGDEIKKNEDGKLVGSVKYSNE